MFFFISCCLILFSNNVNAKSVSELEQEALSQFVEVYDLIRYNNKQQAEKIQQLMQKDKDQSKKIELLQLQVTELQKLNAPSTCSQLKKQGIDRDQEIFLDFDGINHGEKPVEVSCQLPQGRTAFGEPVEVKVDDCPDPHCFVHKMPYNPDEMDQIKNLIQRSSVCTQRITIKCKSAPLQFNGVDRFYWIDQNGSNHSFREIGNTTICDEKEPTLLEEVAEVSDKEMLPISGFSYGSISYENQELNVKIGELICTPNMELEESFLIQNQLSELRNEISSTKDNVTSQNEELRDLKVDVTGRVLKTEFESTKLDLRNEIIAKASKTELVTELLDLDARINSTNENLVNQEKQLTTLKIDVEKRALKTQFDTMKQTLQEDIGTKASIIDLQNHVEKTVLKTQFDTMKQTLQDDVNTKASKNQLQNYVEKTALKTQFDTMKQTLQDDINTKASKNQLQNYVEKTALKTQLDTMKQTLQDDINTKASKNQLQNFVEKTALQTQFDTMKQTLQDDINKKASKNQLQNFVEKTALKTQFDTIKQTLQDDINTKASNTEVQSLKEKISENTDNIASLPERIAIVKRLERLCPGQNDPRYKILDNQCFYFEKKYLNFDSANKNCQEKLGASGRLYEPNSVSEMKKVGKLGDEVFTSFTWVWLGVTDKRVESQLYNAYNSNGLPINFTPTWYTRSYASRGKGNYCVLMRMPSTDWRDHPCTYTRGSICQSNL